MQVFSGFYDRVLFLTSMALLTYLCSCTLSFQNISTHGVANDIVDDEFETDPDIAPDLSIPAI